MSLHRNILIPTDFSETSTNAFIYGMRYADMTQQDINVLHVVYPEMESFDFPIFSGSATKNKTELARIALSDYIISHHEELKEYLHGELGIHSIIKLGAPNPVIVDLAKEIEPSMIIMGTQGKSAQQHKILGSTTANLLNKSPVPVLSVPPNYSYKGISNVAFASDFQESDPEEISHFANLLKPFSPMLHFVHIQSDKVDKEEEAAKLKLSKEKFKEHVPFMQMKFHLIEGKKIQEKLSEFIAEHDLDLMAMFKPDRPWYQRIFKMSISREMVLNAHIPVLVLRPDKIVK